MTADYGWIGPAALAQTLCVRPWIARPRPERIGTEQNEPLTARPTWLQNGGVMEDCHGDAECKEFA